MGAGRGQTRRTQARVVEATAVPGTTPVPLIPMMTPAQVAAQLNQAPQAPLTPEERKYLRLVRRLEKQAEKIAEPGKGKRNQKHYDDLLLVGTTLANEIKKMYDEWTARPTEEHNYFITRLAPELASGSKNSRQFTSRLGYVLESFARKLVKERYGSSSLPEILYSSLMSEEEKLKIEGEFPESAKAQERSVVWTSANRDEVRNQAKNLVQHARNKHKIGTAGFRKAFRRAQEQVREAPKQEPWSLLVDAVVLNPMVGVVEIKTGGELDSTKGEVETERLIAAGLAYNDANLPLHFVLLYPNRGEGKTPKGSLPAYFASGAQTSGLLVGETWWQRVLPRTVSLKEMLMLFAEVGKVYQFKGAH